MQGHSVVVVLASTSRVWTTIRYIEMCVILFHQHSSVVKHWYIRIIYRWVRSSTFPPYVCLREGNRNSVAEESEH